MADPKATENVEWQLKRDRLYYGSCYWRIVAGQKVRVPPQEVIVTEEGKLLHYGTNFDVLTAPLDEDSSAEASAECHTAAEATILVLERMSEFERAMFFEKLNTRFCLNCGSADGRHCYCQMDD